MICQEKGIRLRTLEIDREDMLALTRRMTAGRSSVTRIAGAYVDPGGDIDGTFNIRFLKLSGAEKTKNLNIAKAIPFSGTNKNLKRYVIPDEARGRGSIWQLLAGARTAGLENDSLLDVFYEIIAGQYHSDKEYGIYLFHDRYDIPAKAADHERLGESENVFEYLICAICPVSGDYEAGSPECGFLFPSFSNGSAMMNCVDIFQSDEQHPRSELENLLLGCGE